MDIEVHDIVQVVPGNEWVGCLVIVTEVKSWGIQGYVQIPLQGQAHIRLKFEDIEKVGKAAFVMQD